MQFAELLSEMGINEAETLERFGGIQMLLENQVSGIIFAGGRGKGDYYNQHIRDVAKKVPVVLADEFLEDVEKFSR